ncbi:nucleoside deaminase [uncultured Limnobacter sp.]|jgi:tRNA(adenine34) deaminase|uniref:nucleoside deaminase n=1 Tax=uncultured Limnobacter sp. TaxID=199681 RepID=UPI0030F6DF82
MQTSNFPRKFSVLTHQGQAEDLPWMELALQQAELAAQHGEVPIGAALVINSKAVAQAHNAPVSLNDACAHAEIQVIRQACQSLGNYRLGAQATLYVTLQPCLMCIGAILHARIGRVVVGCSQSRFNGDLTQSLAVFEQAEAWHPCAFETGCMAQASEKLLGNFFKTRRKQREQAVADLASLLHLPNANKQTIDELALLGFHTPQDFLLLGLEQASQRLAERSAELKTGPHEQQAAILASLCDYLNGEPVRSWKQYL